VVDFEAVQLTPLVPTVQLTVLVVLQPELLEELLLEPLDPDDEDLEPEDEEELDPDDEDLDPDDDDPLEAEALAIFFPDCFFS
jgi:hypothetical protein